MVGFQSSLGSVYSFQKGLSRMGSLLLIDLISRVLEVCFLCFQFFANNFIGSSRGLLLGFFNNSSCEVAK
jgi:hypothetical protein